MTAPKKRYLWEVGVPVCELWVMRVEAETREEAYRLAKSNQGGAYQICTTSGKKYMRKLRQIQEGEKSYDNA